MFRFVSKQSKTSDAVEMSSLIFDYKQRSFGSRYVLKHFETLLEFN